MNIRLATISERALSGLDIIILEFYPLKYISFKGSHLNRFYYLFMEERACIIF